MTKKQIIALEQGQVSYVPYFLDVFEQQQYFEELVESLAWQQDQIKIFGRLVKIPRMQAWYGDEEALYRYSGISMTPHPWTDTLMSLKALVEQACNTRFNSVLANWYRDAQDKMGYHSDNEKELGSEPIIASLSLGCTRKFTLKHKHTDEKQTLNLVGGSLLIMSGQTQQYYKHAITAQKKELDGRVNLTFRMTYPLE
jgi:alkylated DNA repair dioxygenase AlkB